MLIAMPESIASDIPFSDRYALHEMEVLPGRSIYTQPMKDIPKGVFLTWEQLTDDQRAKFMDAHAELAKAATKLRTMFVEEFANTMDTCLG
ncbi:MAG: hypothetical protein Q8O35_09230 [Humidesulfovibrio sp.]|jgi:hypothetical protein|uniref:hypothetical protein n=1 Tax=Humidesulfovibrio sp. TaxID=2910988 RepID=UPI00273598C5|nr:hypothetical protein [Humidesulfovibrio sp.]MDP2848362.1 hypothetical protein [Humidesulfovibrio sp.]